MGRTRTILELGLAGGALLSILALALPQSSSPLLETKPTSVIPMASEEAVAAMTRSEAESTSQEGVAIAHFLGIAQFIKSPTEYGFACGLACDPTSTDATGEVVSASLEGDRMEIEYRYLAAGITKTGRLIGTLNSDGVFAGTYQIAGTAASTQEAITFTFAADGSAKGNAGDSKTSVRIFL